MNARRDRLTTVLVTIAGAMFLTLLPMPHWLQLMWPYWVALVLIYWCLEVQGLVTLGAAFATGVVLDLLTGSLLGLHALSLVILVYLVTRFRARLRFFPPWQQALAILALLMNDRIVLLWILVLRGEPMPPIEYWISPLIGTAIWPWLFLLLDRYRGVMRQRASLP